MNGVETTAALRRLHPENLIIGFSIENREREFLDAGADMFIRKDELSSRLVEELQGSSRSRRINAV
jgi:DNA-binding NarL/FixJ family response regulator